MTSASTRRMLARVFGADVGVVATPPRFVAGIVLTVSTDVTPEDVVIEEGRARSLAIISASILRSENDL